jgi:hypothetical protein
VMARSGTGTIHSVTTPFDIGEFMPAHSKAAFDGHSSLKIISIPNATHA